MGRTIDLQAGDGVAGVYLTGNRGDPGVLFHMDAIGLRPQLEEMADRISSWGYTVLVPNVFFRDGRAAELARFTMNDTSAYLEAGAERHYKELEGLLARTLR